MSIADAQRVITLEYRVAGLAEASRVLVSRVAALEDHLADFQAAVEARQTRETSAACGSPSHPVSTLQLPSSTPARDSEPCPTCAQRREQGLVRRHRHRAKIAAANGKVVQEAAT